MVNYVSPRQLGYRDVCRECDRSPGSVRLHCPYERGSREMYEWLAGAKEALADLGIPYTVR